MEPPNPIDQLQDTINKWNRYSVYDIHLDVIDTLKQISEEEFRKIYGKMICGNSKYEKMVIDPRIKVWAIDENGYMLTGPGAEYILHCTEVPHGNSEEEARKMAQQIYERAFRKVGGDVEKYIISICKSFASEIKNTSGSWSNQDLGDFVSLYGNNVLKSGSITWFRTDNASSLNSGVIILGSTLIGSVPTNLFIDGISGNSNTLIQAFFESFNEIHPHNQKQESLLIFA